MRGRKCEGIKFRREYPIPPDNVDFICLELQLVFEIAGKHHQTLDGQIYVHAVIDFCKRKVFASCGFTVIKS
ncbi:MAG: DUF559 domain-containing protein [Planctomycetaceae bacterium]|nr:DUF559 domain-containing protein [Planctomycetaceae bacterium]